MWQIVKSNPIAVSNKKYLRLRNSTIIHKDSGKLNNCLLCSFTLADIILNTKPSCCQWLKPTGGSSTVAMEKLSSPEMGNEEEEKNIWN